MTRWYCVLGCLRENGGDPVVIQTRLPAVIPQFTRAAVTIWFVAVTQHPEPLGFSSSPCDSENFVKKNEKKNGSTFMGI